MCDEEIFGLEKRLEFFESFFGFNTERPLEKLYGELKSMYLSSMRYSRGCYLINLAQSGSEFFTDLPDAGALFRYLNEKTTSYMVHFSPMFVQGLCLNIVHVYEDPESFALIVNEFFTNDSTFINLFAYSTFPTIYGFFTIKEQMSYASTFLETYFSISHDFLLPSELFKAFFLSSHMFYQALWYELNMKFNQLHGNGTKEFYKNSLVESLKKSVSLLSKYHLQAFKSFAKFFPDNLISTFFHDLLLVPFLIASQGSSFMNLYDLIEDFALFLKSLTDNVSFVISIDIINCFLYSHDGNQCEDISFRSISWSESIPIMMCERDVQLFYDIISQGSAGWKHPVREKPKFSNSFSSFIIDVFPQISEVPEGNNIYSLLPIFESSIKFEENDEYNRVWFQFLSSSSDSTSLLAHYKKLSHQAHLDCDIRKYLLHKMIHFLEFKSEGVSDLIKKHQGLQSLSKHKSSIVSQCNMFFHRFTTKFLKKQIASLPPMQVTKKIWIAIETIQLDLCIDSESFFELLCASLDCLQLQVSNSSQHINNTFQSVLDECVTESMMIIHQTPSLLSKSKATMRHVTSLKSLSKLKLGKILKLIVLFTKQLRTVLGDEWEKNWKIFFFSSLYGNSQSDILPIFLFFHYFVFSFSPIEKGCTGSIIDLWKCFSLGMWSIVAQNQSLLQLTQNPQTVSMLYLNRK